MTLSQIRYFLTVAQERSFSKAAQVLIVSQPAVSRQVALLERELGVELFRRTSQGIALTDEGEAFAEFFRTSEQTFNDLLERTRRHAAPLRGTIVIGGTEGWDLSSFFPQLSAHFAQRYPEVELVLSGYNHHEVVQTLERGKVDVVITSEALLQDKPHLGHALLTHRRGVLLFSAQHPLAHKKDLTLADFRDEPFYNTAPANMRKTNVELFSLCAKADFVPNIEHVPTLSAVYMKLSSGHGVMFCNDWMMAINNPLFTTFPLDLDRGVSVAWRKEENDPLVALFVRELRDWFAGHM